MCVLLPHSLAVQVWTKLAIGFTAIAVTIVGSYGFYQLRNEDVDLRAAAERDLELTGTAVQLAVGNALRDQQMSDVGDVIDAVKRRDPALDVLVFDRSNHVIAGSKGPLEPVPIVPAAIDEAQRTGHAVVRFDEPESLSNLVGAFPIHGSDAAEGTVVLVRPLDELRRDLSSETRSTALSLATLVIGLAGAGWFLASTYVRRPLRDLVNAMQAVRAGDLTAKSLVRRDDEIGVAVTEFNAMMADLAEARRRLEIEADAREQLEGNLLRTDKLVTVGQLSAGLAHEIGSPLQVLNGRARALADRTDVPADVRRTAEILTNESDRITRIVEQLLMFSRQTAPAFTGAQLGAPVRDIVELFASEAHRHNVRLESHIDEPLTTVQADVDQVQQVVVNLLHNALRATPAGGQISLRLEDSSFTRGDQPLPSVLLTISDTGEGIPDTILPRIFEPFFTTRSNTGGTGLGLAVVKSIVDAHHGTIAVATGKGEGTRVSVHFPVARGALAGGWVA